MGGRLEHEIRLLPQVLSCSLLKDDYVVVLIDPSADPRTIQLAVEHILHNAGSEATVRVVGPPEATTTTATRSRSTLVATAAVATVAAIGVGSLVGGLTGVDHPTKGLGPTTPVGAGAADPFDSVNAWRGLQSTLHTSGSPAVRLPVETPAHTLRVLPVSFGKAAEAVSLSAAMPQSRRVHAQATSVSRRGTRDLRRGQRAHKARHLGKGPRPWSHSSSLRTHQQMQRGWDH